VDDSAPHGDPTAAFKRDVRCLQRAHRLHETLRVVALSAPGDTLSPVSGEASTIRTPASRTAVSSA